MLCVISLKDTNIATTDCSSLSVTAAPAPLIVNTALISPPTLPWSLIPCHSDDPELAAAIELSMREQREEEARRKEPEGGHEGEGEGWGGSTAEAGAEARLDWIGLDRAG